MTSSQNQGEESLEPLEERGESEVSKAVARADAIRSIKEEFLEREGIVGADIVRDPATGKPLTTMERARGKGAEDHPKKYLGGLD